MQAAREIESVVAVLPPKGTSEEVELSRSVTSIELEAESIVIGSDEDYNSAGEFGRRLKRALSEVEGFFAPMKAAANNAHREVCGREKMMLAPLRNAEATLKRTMGDYALRKEQERRALEEAARRHAQEEADRKLAEAIAHEDAGDEDAAQEAMLDATMADQMSRTMSVTLEQPKADGVSMSKDWVIDILDESKVPVEFAGMVIRPVDDKAVMRLIRASKGKFEIPGVTYHEVAKMSIRK
jgi:hypothetical protein